MAHLLHWWASAQEYKKQSTGRSWPAKIVPPRASMAVSPVAFKGVEAFSGLSDWLGNRHEHHADGANTSIWHRILRDLT